MNKKILFITSICFSSYALGIQSPAQFRSEGDYTRYSAEKNSVESTNALRIYRAAYDILTNNTPENREVDLMISELRSTSRKLDCRINAIKQKMVDPQSSIMNYEEELEYIQNANLGTIREDQVRSDYMEYPGYSISGDTYLIIPRPQTVQSQYERDKNKSYILSWEEKEIYIKQGFVALIEAFKKSRKLIALQNMENINRNLEELQKQLNVLNAQRQDIKNEEDRILRAYRAKQDRTYNLEQLEQIKILFQRYGNALNESFPKNDKIASLKREIDQLIETLDDKTKDWLSQYMEIDNGGWQKSRKPK